MSTLLEFSSMLRTVWGDASISEMLERRMATNRRLAKLTRQLGPSKRWRITGTGVVYRVPKRLLP